MSSQKNQRGLPTHRSRYYDVCSLRNSRGVLLAEVALFWPCKGRDETHALFWCGRDRQFWSASVLNKRWVSKTWSPPLSCQYIHLCKKMGTSLESWRHSSYDRRCRAEVNRLCWGASTIGAAHFAVAGSISFSASVGLIATAASCFAVGLARYRV